MGTMKESRMMFNPLGFRQKNEKYVYKASNPEKTSELVSH